MTRTSPGRPTAETTVTTRHQVGDLTVVAHRLPFRSSADAPADVPVFVLVHGIAVSSRYYQPTADALSRRGTVYVVDLPGYGQSPTPKRDVSIADHAAALNGFLTDLGVDNPTIVGHSMGSQIVSRLVVDFPTATDRIVLMAPTMPANERTLFRGAWRLLVDARLNPIRADIVILNDYLFRCGIPYFMKQQRHLFSDRIELRLAEVAARTLVINGDRDLVVPVSWARRIADGLPDGRLEIVSGPHVIMFTDPERIAELVAGHARR